MVRRNRPENEDASTNALEWFLSTGAPAEATRPDRDPQPPRAAAPPPPASFDPHLVASSVPARPRATSGKRHPMLRMGEVIVATALVLVVSVGGVTSIADRRLDAEYVALPEDEAAPRSESRERQDSRAIENAPVDSLADGDAVVEDPAAPSPPAEAARRHPVLRPVSPQPPAPTSKAPSTEAPAPTPAPALAPDLVTPPRVPDSPTAPATPRADPAPAPGRAPGPPAGSNPGSAPGPPLGPAVQGAGDATVHGERSRVRSNSPVRNADGGS